MTDRELCRIPVASALPLTARPGWGRVRGRLRLECAARPLWFQVLIQFRQLTLARGSRRLIEDASMQLHTGWRVGVIGANGSGKSSLFALLRGELHTESGDCDVPRDWRIASVAQETPPLAMAAIDFVLDGDE